MRGALSAYDEDMTDGFVGFPSRSYNAPPVALVGVKSDAEQHDPEVHRPV